MGRVPLKNTMILFITLDLIDVVDVRSTMYFYVLFLSSSLFFVVVVVVVE